MSELRERGMAPEIKPPRRIRTNQGPAFSESKDEKGNITITLLPGRDPYEDLAREDDEIIDITGAESESDIDPDMESADDISVVSLDSLAEINREKVREVWKGMSEVKTKEAVLYNNLAEIVEDMSPVVIQEPSEEHPNQDLIFHKKLRVFVRKLTTNPCSRKSWLPDTCCTNNYLKSKDKKYKPMSYRQTAKKFQVNLKGLKEICRGAAYERDRRRLERMVKKEELDVEPEFPPQEEEGDDEEPSPEAAQEPETTQGVKRKHEDTE